MIFTNQFFRICHIGMTQYFLGGFNQFFDPENILHTKIILDTKSMILCHLEVERLPKLDFYGGYLKNGLNPYGASKLFLVTSLLTFPGSSSSKWKVLGMHGDQFWPMDYLCQL